MAAGAKLPTAHLCRLVITTNVKSGATDNYIDPHLIPRLREFMIDCKILTVPHLVSVAGGYVLEGAATGTVHGTVTDDGGNTQYVSFSVAVVPELGTNLFYVTVMQKGVASLFYPTNPRLEKESSAVLPMQDLGVDPTTGERPCSIDVKLTHQVDNSLDLGVTIGGVAM